MNIHNLKKYSRVLVICMYINVTQPFLVKYKISWNWDRGRIQLCDSCYAIMDFIKLNVLAQLQWVNEYLQKCREILSHFFPGEKHIVMTTSLAGLTSVLKLYYLVPKHWHHPLHSCSKEFGKEMLPWQWSFSRTLTKYIHV